MVCSPQLGHPKIRTVQYFFKIVSILRFLHPASDAKNGQTDLRRRVCPKKPALGDANKRLHFAKKLLDWIIKENPLLVWTDETYAQTQNYGQMQYCAEGEEAATRGKERWNPKYRPWKPASGLRARARPGSGMGGTEPWPP